MIGLVIEDLEASIDLFQQNQSGHLMQKSQIGELHPFVCPFDQLLA